MQFNREKIYAEMLSLGEKLELPRITKYPKAAEKVLDQTLDYLSTVIPTLQRLAEQERITLLILAQNNLLLYSDSFLRGEAVNDNQRKIDKDVTEIIAEDFKTILEEKYIMGLEEYDIVAVMAVVFATNRFKALVGAALLADSISKPGGEVTFHPRYE